MFWKTQKKGNTFLEVKSITAQERLSEMLY